MRPAHSRNRVIKLKCDGYELVFHLAWRQERRSTAYDTWLEMAPSTALVGRAPRIKTLPKRLRRADVQRLTGKFRRYLRALDDADEFSDASVDGAYELEASAGWYDAERDAGNFSLKIQGIVGKNPRGPGWVHAGIATSVDLREARRFVDDLESIDFDPA